MCVCVCVLAHVFACVWVCVGIDMYVCMHEVCTGAAHMCTHTHVGIAYTVMRWDTHAWAHMGIMWAHACSERAGSRRYFRPWYLTQAPPFQGLLSAVNPTCTALALG